MQKILQRLLKIREQWYYRLPLVLSLSLVVGWLLAPEGSERWTEAVRYAGLCVLIVEGTRLLRRPSHRL